MSNLLLYNHLASIFFPALLLSLWLTPVVIRHSFRLNAIDRPNDRKVQKKAVSRLGGAAMVAGLVLPLAFFSPLDRTMSALLGSLFGFLRYNTYPANLFMGDTGSLLLGYTLSATAVMLVQNGHMGMHLSPTMVAGVLALPITDTLLVMSRRARRGQNPFLPDRTHLHHRLLDLGFPHSVVVPILYLGAGAFGVQAWFLREAPDWVQFAAVVVLAALVHGAVYALQHCGFRWKGGEASVPCRTDAEYTGMARVMGKSVRLAAGAIAIGLTIPIVALPVVPPVIGGVAMAVLVFVAVLFPWRAQLSRPSVVYGLMWFACLCLLALLQAAPGSAAWVPAYLAVLSAVVLLWVLLKMKYRGHRLIVRISSFELLLLGAALFVSLVMVPALHMGDGLRNMLLTVSLESVAFLLAMKILIRRQPHRSSMIAAGFLLALALIVAKGFLFTEKAANFVAAPAAASAPAVASDPRSEDDRVSASLPPSKSVP